MSIYKKKSYDNLAMFYDKFCELAYDYLKTTLRYLNS